MALIIDVQTLLDNCADGGAHYGTNSFEQPILASDGTIAPYIVWTRIVSTDNVSLLGPSGLQNTRIQVDIFAPRIADAESTKQAVDSALQAAGFPVIPLNSQDLYEPAVKLFRIIREYSVWYDETAVERLSFTSSGFVLDAFGRPIELRGWNDFRIGTATAADFQDTVATGGNFTRIGVRWSGGGTYDNPAVDGYDPSGSDATGWLLPDYVTALDAQIDAVEAAGPWWGFVFDTNCGQGSCDLIPGACVYDGITNTNLLNNPAFKSRFMAMQRFVVARYRNRKRRAYWEPLAEPNFATATAADLKALYADLLANIRGQSPGDACLIGGLGAYDANQLSAIYDASFGQNTGYTANCLKGNFAGGIGGVQTVMNTLWQFRKTTGAWVFMQQLGDISSHDTDDSLKTQAFQYAAQKKLGYAYWERRGSTDATQYSAYFQSGSTWIRKDGVYSAVTAGFGY